MTSLQVGSRVGLTPQLLDHLPDTFTLPIPCLLMRVELLAINKATRMQLQRPGASAFVATL